MSFLLGSKLVKSLVANGDSLQFVQSKLSEKLFIGDELPVFKMVEDHLKEFHTLPAMETFLTQFPNLDPVTVPEPPDYYLKEVENRYGYRMINSACDEAKKILKANPKDVEEAMAPMAKTVQDWNVQKYRQKILDYTSEAHDLLTTAYFGGPNSSVCYFGWNHLDSTTGGMAPGDVISMVGRPGAGKTYGALWVATHNVFNLKKNVLFVSMEMVPLPLAQRVSAINSKLPISQIQTKQMSHKSLNKWLAGLTALANGESGKLYIVDGNLAANVDDIYALAGALDVDMVVVDGAYLVKHPNKHLDRFTRVAENVELMKARTTTFGVPSYATWQFKKDENKTDKKTGAPVKKAKSLDDIGYSDAIAQISSVVLGLEQEESVETLVRRRVSILKGRNGETGSFLTHWDFNVMNFAEIHESDEEKVAALEML